MDGLPLNIKDPEALLENIEFDEGLKREPYYCTEDKLTIGIGKNLDSNPPSQAWLDAHGFKGDRDDVMDLKEFFDENPITEEQAWLWLTEDLHKFIKSCRRIFPQPDPQESNSILGFEDFNDARQIALVNMCYNLGAAGLDNFPNMKKAFKAGDWNLAAIEALDSKWARVDVPNRAKRVAKVIREGALTG